MTPFSASDAALEGFNLLRRRWRVVLGWAAFNFVALLMLIVVTAVLSFVASAMGAASGAAVALGGLIVGFGGLFTQTILAAGVFRLDLAPEEPSFLHLRLGKDELRLFLVWLISITGVWVLGWVGAMVDQALGGWGVWMELIAISTAVYLALRFCLSAPISYAEKRIDFLRSWRLSNGRVWALLGMSALSLSLIALISATVFIGLALLGALVAGLDGVAVVFGGAESLQRHPGIFIVAAAVQIVLVPVMWVLATAPLAAAYRAFTEAKDAPATA